MPTLQKEIKIKAPLEEVFAYLTKPANLPQIWPSLYEVKDVQTLPKGGHSFMWLFNFAGHQVKGTIETAEYVPNERIVDKAVGDVESTCAWTFYGDNGTTEVTFKADYEFPERFIPRDEKPFAVRWTELEAEYLLTNLKAKLEV